MSDDELRAALISSLDEAPAGEFDAGSIAKRAVRDGDARMRARAGGRTLWVLAAAAAIVAALFVRESERERERFERALVTHEGAWVL